MLRSNNQKTKTFPLSFMRLPTVIWFTISMLFHSQTRISEFFAIHKINIWTISRFLQLLSLLFNVFNQIVVKISWTTEIQLLYFCSVKFCYFIINFSQILLWCGFEKNALLWDEKIYVLRVSIRVNFVLNEVHLKRRRCPIAASYQLRYNIFL